MMDNHCHALVLFFFKKCLLLQFYLFFMVGLFQQTLFVFIFFVVSLYNLLQVVTQSLLTCSKSTMATPDESIKSVQI